MGSRADLVHWRPLVWILAAFYGAMGAALLASLGPLVGGAFLVLAVFMVGRGPALTAISGLLVGFGSMWWAFIAYRLVSGIQPNDSPLEGWAALATAAILGGAALGYREIARGR